MYQALTNGRGQRLPASSAPVAQLDRAPDYESGGQRFESFRARHFRFHRFQTRVCRIAARFGAAWFVVFRVCPAERSGARYASRASARSACSLDSQPDRSGSAKWQTCGFGPFRGAEPCRILLPARDHAPLGAGRTAEAPMTSRRGIPHGRCAAAGESAARRAGVRRRTGEAGQTTAMLPIRSLCRRDRQSSGMQGRLRRF